MYYIVGLGNPGDEYQRTRHNVGRAYLEQFAASHGYNSWSKSTPAKAMYTHAQVGGEAIELVIPETFMNKSGETLRYYVDKHEAKPEEFIVLHDDVDLPLGEVKVSKGRGDGGNNGIKSIVQHLGTKDFVRVRIGVASRHWWTGETVRPRGGGALEKFVLGRFTRKETGQLDAVYTQVTQAVELIVTKGAEAAMNQVN